MRTMDLRGKRSPYPIIQIAKTIKKADSGETLNFLVNDRNSIDDVYEWVKRTGHILKGVVRKGDYWSIQITKRK